MSAVTKQLTKWVAPKAKTAVAKEVSPAAKISAVETVAKREAATAGAGAAAALRSRRRGYRSLLSPAREDAMAGLTDKLGG